MKTGIDTQAVQIALCLLLGLASGIIYDAFRALRRDSSWRALTAVLDASFCAAVCFALFVIGMSAGEGSLSIAMLAFVAAGFALYMALFSNAAMKLFRGLLRLIKWLLSPLKKMFSAISEMTKSALSKAVYCLKQQYALRKKSGGEQIEKAEDGEPCSHRNYGDADLWRGDAVYDSASPEQDGKRK